MRGDKIVPGVWFQLLDRKRHAPVFRINSGYDRIDLLAFLQHFARMLHATRPGNIGDMDEAVHTVFNFDESAEVSQIAHAAMHAIADVIPLSNCLPGILLHLLHPETDAASSWIYAQHFDFDSIARTHDFARMLDALGPAHL